MTEEDLEFVTYPCASCRTVNRIPRRRLYDNPKCGHCHHKVFPHTPITVSDAQWKSEVEDCPIPILVEFWAPWCEPCKVLAPILDAISAERVGRLKVVKINVDENPRTAGLYKVRSIPMMLVLRGPLLVDQLAGALSKEAIDLRLERVI